MRHVFHQLYYHLVWATQGRELRLEPVLRPVLFETLQEKCRELKCTWHEINAVSDHLHIALEIPPSIAISTVVGGLKGASSRALNRISPGAGYWQDGYGIVTYRKAELARVREYVANQQTRHHKERLWPVLEKTDTECDEEYTDFGA